MNDKLLISKFMDGGSVYDNASSSMQDNSANYPGGPGGRGKGNKRRARRAKRKCSRKGCSAKKRYRVR
tara:strand:- start:2534 stop:2737 length:204 start_codon:yes stop_codon:yes gene_type:complete